MLRIAVTLILLCITFSSFSQEKPSYADQLKAIEDEMDSLSIFTLIDSLFSLESKPISELNLRVGFTTSVTSAGRDYDLNQSGIAPGISYYHRSGVYGDLSGYWNSGIEPSYNPTVLSIGYLGSMKKSQWDYSIDLEKWFYNPADSSENSLTNSIGGSISYDFKWGFSSIDYSFLFGKETASRIIPNLSGSIQLGRWWIFKNISVYPSANIMIGNNDITKLRITNQEIRSQTSDRLNRLLSFSDLNTDQKKFITFIIRRAFNNGTISEQDRNQLLLSLRNSSELTQQNKEAIGKILNEGFDTIEYVNSNEFGILNYSFTLPVSFSTNHLQLLISYTYNIPVQLPGEFIEVNPIGYFGASISYRIPFK